MKLSVLDQTVAAVGRSHVESIQNTVALAQSCEAWGYHRFWVSEHHSHPTIVGTAPEVLMAAIAARTQRIRIGSAGVMLPHYAALKVAEQFRVLDALAPGRIDLGVGRAPGSDQRTAQLLNPNARAVQYFPQQVQELQAWVQGQALYGVHAYPAAAQNNDATGPLTAPSLWMLGSSDYGAQLAAELGLPYAFAYFITDGQGAAEALALYRALYKPSPDHPKPQAVLCVWALAADTEEEAWHLFQSRARARMDRNRGLNAALLPPEEATREWTAAEELALAQLRQGALVGSAAQVAEKLQRLAKTHEVDELAIITWTHSAKAQARSYELLAQALIA